jgi:hypothetical protein
VTIPSRIAFRPRARIIRTIGDRLISGPEAAVIELVKNAHDADARAVTISFELSVSTEGARIVVSDNGHGMSLEDIRTKWMEPATTDKANRKTSPGGRSLLGSKGIGRFASAKLGRFLDLRTSVLRDQNLIETVEIRNIDWEAFDGERYLDQIDFPIEVSQGPDPPGTTLAIRHLRVCLESHVERAMRRSRMMTEAA